MLNMLDLPPDAPTSSDVLKLDVEGKLDLTVQSFIAQRTAILGSTGGGKTNTLALILEKVLPFMPTVIFDQHDEYWGLCEQYEILRVGKSELSQIKAGPEQAIQIAEISHSKRLSVLVEMLDMSRTDRQEFVELYCSHIWELNKKSKLPYGIVLEEAQNFIPEGRTTPAQEMMKQFALEGAGFADKVGQLWAIEQLTGKAVRTLADLSQDDWRTIRNAAYPHWTEEEWVVCREFAAALAGHHETYLELMGQRRLL